MSQVSTHQEPQKDRIRNAFVFAYPLFAFAETRFRAVQVPDKPDRHPPNTLKHNRHLSDHTSLWITAPNNDTLYSNAWLDLSAGPIRIRVGKMPEGRYWSLAFMDAFTNHTAVICQRLEGTGELEVTVVGPEQDLSGISGRIIQMPGLDGWLFCRCLVDGPDDLPQAYAMQDRIEILTTTSLPTQQRIPPIQPIDPENFLDVVNELLQRNPVPTSETALLDHWSQIGIGPFEAGAWYRISAETQTLWSTTILQNYEELSQAGQQGRRDFRGWIAAASDIGNFGDNYPLRASVALGGLGALELIEAMYFVKYTDKRKKPLTGKQRYLLKVPACGIPTESFWSFTLYGYTPDGRRVLVENPISRYSVGNRTRDLVYNADGSLNIVLQHDAPSNENLRANWLPAPLGTFHISLRTYVPHPELRDGSAPLPIIEAVD